MIFIDDLLFFLTRIRMAGFGRRHVSRRELDVFLGRNNISPTTYFSDDTYPKDLESRILKEVNSGKISLRSRYLNPQKKEDLQQQEVPLVRCILVRFKCLNISVFDEDGERQLKLIGDMSMSRYSISEKMISSEFVDKAIERIMSDCFGLPSCSYTFKMADGSYEFIRESDSRQYPEMKLDRCEYWGYEVYLLPSFSNQFSYTGNTNDLMTFRWKDVMYTDRRKI